MSKELAKTYDPKQIEEKNDQRITLRNNGSFNGSRMWKQRK